MSFFDVALSLTPRVGSRTARQLVELYFSAENVFSQSFEELCSVDKLSEEVALAIVRRVAFSDAEVQIEHCKKHCIDIVSLVDEYYPPQLREVTDAPYVLYVQGDKKVLTRNIISVIGSRRSTSYGERVTFNLVKELSDRVYNLVIASGLAIGVDSLAHRAALSAGVPTIAFVPTSLPDITPAQHTRLAREILDAGGALVSEVPHTSRVSHGKPVYMARNRIVVGSAGATIVVEAAFNGGAYKAAVNALNDGLVVGAIPGRLSDSGSFGCNMLISSHRAFMVMGAESILRELNWEDRRVEGSDEKISQAKRVELERLDNLTDLQRKVLLCFEEEDALHISKILERSSLPVGELTGVLMELVVFGVVKAQPGALYERLIPLGSTKK